MPYQEKKEQLYLELFEKVVIICPKTLKPKWRKNQFVGEEETRLRAEKDIMYHEDKLMKLKHIFTYSKKHQSNCRFN